MTNKADPRTHFRLQNSACLHQYTKWLICNFFEYLRNLFCETFLFIFRFQWQLFTAHFLCSTFSIKADVNLYFQVERPRDSCLNAAALLEAQTGWRKASSVYIHFAYGRFALQTQGLETFFFFPFNENINPADAKQ